MAPSYFIDDSLDCVRKGMLFFYSANFFADFFAARSPLSIVEVISINVFSLGQRFSTSLSSIVSALSILQSFRYGRDPHPYLRGRVKELVIAVCIHNLLVYGALVFFDGKKVMNVSVKDFLSDIYLDVNCVY